MTLARWPVPGFQGRVLEQVALAPRTTWRIGGPARWLASPADAGDLARLVTGLPPEMPVMTLGGGSNLLVPDEGFDGVVISLAAGFGGITVEDATCLQVGAGVTTRQLAHFAWRQGLQGAEFLAGIPGRVGGAVIMNAGAYGGDMADIVETVTVMDASGVRRVLARPDLGFAYRTSRIPPAWTVLQARVRLMPANRETIRQRMRTMNRQRAASQPLAQPSAGSTFKNPPAGPRAWALIEAAGMRGRCIGDAQVSEKHCNFLVNRGQARAVDMMRLIDWVRQEVFRSQGIRLELEVRLVGPHGIPWQGEW